jgi:hypothetical protein
MSFSPDFTLSYVSGGQSWKLTPSALPAAQQDVVLKALQDGNLDTQDLAILADLQDQFPSAFVKQSYLDNLPPPEEFAMSRFSTAWSGMDINALMAFLNEMLTQLSADMREQSNKKQIGQIEHSMDLADQKKMADENSANDAFAAAMVAGALAIVSAVVGFAGAVGSAVGTSRQLAKAKDLALDKAQTLCDKFKAQKNLDNFDRAARKADDQAKQANAAAIQAHPIGNKSSGEIAAKYRELKAVDTGTMTTAQKKAHQKEIDQVVTSFEYKKEAEQQQEFAKVSRGLADTERQKLDDAELKLSALDEDIRRLDAKSQELANLTRLISVMAPMFEQMGHMGGAKYTENSKIWDALSAYITAQIQNTDALRDLFQQNAQAFKELFDSVRDMLQKYLEGQNQANSNIANHI